MQMMPYTLPVVNEITPSSNFLVDPSDFTMSVFIPTVAAEDPPAPINSEVYVEQWQKLEVRYPTDKEHVYTVEGVIDSKPGCQHSYHIFSLLED